MNPQALILKVLLTITIASAVRVKAEDNAKDTRWSEKLINDLLDYSAPPPDWKEYLNAHPHPLPPPEAKADATTLTNYWAYAPESAQPDRATQMRLLEIIEQNPARANDLLSRLPVNDAEVYDRLEAVVEREAKKKNREAETIRATLRDWLMLHSKYFRDELKRQTLRPDDVSQLAADKAMAALLEMDRAGAHKFLSEQSENSNLTGRAIALRALRNNFSSESSDSVKNEWREKLREIAANPKADREARRVALLEIMKEQWEGRDKWFLALFSDETLMATEQGAAQTTLLHDVAALDPDYWIPKVTTLVDRSGMPRTNAVYCLVQFQREQARADAFRPLLPWINNPNWAPDSKELMGRLRLIQNLDRVDLPESVPALLEAAKTATDWELEGIADALARYKIREAIPLLKRGIVRDREEYHRRHLVESIYAQNGFTEKEIVEALRAFAIKTSTERGRKEIEEADDVIPKTTLQPLESIGDQLAREEIKDAHIIEQLRSAADDLQKTNGAAADSLHQIIARCLAPSASDLIVRQLRGGHFTAQWAAELLEKRKSLGERLKDSQKLQGAALGLQTAIAADPTRIKFVLEGNDRFAKLCLLASARLARVSLPIDLVEPMLGTSDAMLDKAAQLYLESNDSAEARTTLWHRAKNKPLLLGSHLGYDPGHFSYKWLGETEQRLIKLVQQSDGPAEIVALLSEGYWGGNGNRILFIYPNRILLHYEQGNGRVSECSVSKTECDRLITWLEKEKIEDLPPYDEHTWDGVQYEYFRASRENARRIFMNNPPDAPSTDREPAIDEKGRPDPRVYSELTNRFLALSQGTMVVRYPALEKFSGYHLVHAREEGEAMRFRLQDEKLSLGLRPDSRNVLEWHSLNKGELAQEFKVEERDEDPLVTPDESEKGVVLKEGPFAGKRLRANWRDSDENRKSGLWIEDEKDKGQLIATGIFGPPIVCPGGDWVVIAKTAENAMWSAPNGVVRINLRTKTSTPVKIRAADNFDPVAWIRPHHRVLLWRARDKEDTKAGPEHPEFFLLDPVTGDYRRVSGEFGPCFDISRRPLQPTTKPNEFWAVKYEQRNNESVSILGRYDEKHFRFAEILQFPNVSFRSENTWVDDKANIVWVILNGDLLRFDLPRQGDSNDAQSGSYPN